MPLWRIVVPSILSRETRLYSNGSSRLFYPENGANPSAWPSCRASWTRSDCLRRPFWSDWTISVRNQISIVRLHCGVLSFLLPTNERLFRGERNFDSERTFCWRATCSLRSASFNEITAFFSLEGTNERTIDPFRFMCVALLVQRVVQFLLSFIMLPFQIDHFDWFALILCFPSVTQMSFQQLKSSDREGEKNSSSPTCSWRYVFNLSLVSARSLSTPGHFFSISSSITTRSDASPVASIPFLSEIHRSSFIASRSATHLHFLIIHPRMVVHWQSNLRLIS